MEGVNLIFKLMRKKSSLMEDKFGSDLRNGFIYRTCFIYEILGKFAANSEKVLNFVIKLFFINQN